MEVPKKILSRKEVQELFGVSNVTVWQWVRKGFIREYTVSRKHYYIYEELIEDLKKMKTD